MKRPKVIKHKVILAGLMAWIGYELTGGYGIPYTAKVRYVLVYGPMMRLVFTLAMNAPAIVAEALMLKASALDSAFAPALAAENAHVMRFA